MKIGLDVGQLVEVVHRSAFTQGLVHEELSFAGWLAQPFQEFGQRTFVEVLGEPEPWRPFSSERMPSARPLEVLAMLMTSPTARICVPSLSWASLNFSKAQREELDHDIVAGRVYFSSVPSRQ